MAGFQHDVAGGSGNLVATSVQSPNYVAGSAGWQIKKDGSAEFNDATIRGGEVIDGTALYYSPSPGAGNLTASTSAAAGTDSSGNAYLAGDTTYYNAGGGVYLAVNIYQDTVSFYASTNGEAGPWTQESTLTGSAGGNLFITAQDPYLLDPAFPSSALLNTTHGGLALRSSAATPSTRAVAVDGGDMQIGSGYAIYASDPTSSTGNAAGWFDITVSLSGWANTASSPPLQGHLMPTNEVKLIGDVSGTAISASPAILGSLPSAHYYRSGYYLIASPAVIASGTITSGQDSPMVQINSSGEIALYNCKGATRIIINYKYPLDYNTT